ncbi:MAG TPA: prepilin peptidase [Acidimicrobiales bacterium]|nr:prepilin peptidase [Acidimicrobiales bacterium]
MDALAGLRALVVPICIVLGLLVGSFSNVVVHRLPRGMSLATPASHCPRCGTTLSWYENVPVVSWVALRGRCRTCRAPISVRYVAMEAATGLAFGLAAAAAPTAALPPVLALLAAGLCAAVVELEGHAVTPPLAGAAAVASSGLVVVAAVTGNPSRLAWAAFGASALAAAALATDAAGPGLGRPRGAAVGARLVVVGSLGWAAGWLWPGAAWAAAGCWVAGIAFSGPARRHLGARQGALAILGGLLLVLAACVPS